MAIVMYHYVRDLRHSRFPEIRGLDTALFREQIRFLKRNYTIVTMEAVLDAAEGNGTLPERAALLTFDDGYIDHYTNVFPILMEEGIQGSFFIPGKTFAEHKLLDVNKVHFLLASAPPEKLLADVNGMLEQYREDYGLAAPDELFARYAQANRFDTKEVIYIKRLLQTVLPETLRNQMTSSLFARYVGVPEELFARELYMNREQIRCMKQCGMFIGLHGYDHYWLGELSEPQMRQDTMQALDVMSEWIEKDRWVMNYPYGSYQDAVIACMAENGCKLGLSTRVGTARLTQEERYVLPRLDTNDFPPKSERYLEL